MTGPLTPALSPRRGERETEGAPLPIGVQQSPLPLMEGDRGRGKDPQRS
ncbi:MAG: hypothetical protein Kow0054_27870 [Deferrisoma sp.]